MTLELFSQLCWKLENGDSMLANWALLNIFPEANVYFFIHFDRLPSTLTKGFDSAFHTSHDVLLEPASASLVKPKNAMGMEASDGRFLF